MEKEVRALRAEVKNLREIIMDKADRFMDGWGCPL